MNPCVKFYQNITEWKWFRIPEMVQLIVYFVCKADHEPYYAYGVLVDRGQVMASRKEIVDELQMSESVFRTCMSRFIKDGYLSTQTQNLRKMIVSVTNYQRYIVDDTQPQNKANNDDVNASKSLFAEEKNESTTTEVKPVALKKKEDVDCDFIVKLYHSCCPSLPKVLKLTDKRKSKIRVRFEEMKYSYETMQALFEKSEASYFLRGDNNRGWKADFDWLFINSTNWVKVLEGKYDNRNNSYTQNGTVANQAPKWSSISERNASVIACQKSDILNTLAKCQQDYESGDISTLVGVEAEL